MRGLAGCSRLRRRASEVFGVIFLTYARLETRGFRCCRPIRPELRTPRHRRHSGAFGALLAGGAMGPQSGLVPRHPRLEVSRCRWPMLQYLSNSGTEIHDGKPLPSGPRAGREFACAYGAVLITVGKAATETKDSHLRSHDSPGSSRSPVWRVITLQITDCQSTYSTYTILLLYWAEYHSTLAAHPRTSDTVQANVPGREPLFGLLCNAPDPSPHRLMQQELPNC